MPLHILHQIHFKIDWWNEFINFHFKIFSTTDSILMSSWIYSSSSQFHVIFLFRLLDRWKILIFLRPCHPLPPSRFFLLLVVIERRIVAEKGMLGHIQCTLFTIFLREKNIFFLVSTFFVLLCMLHIDIYVFIFYLHLTVYIYIVYS